MKKANLFRGIAACTGALGILGTCITVQRFNWSGSINQFLGIESGNVTGNGSMVYASSYGELNAENLAKLVKDEIAYCKEEMEEGAVLLENDGVLPLDASVKNVSLFGRASYDIIYKSHAGGGIVSAASAISLKKAREDSGFKVNDTLYNAYAGSSTKRVKGSKEETSLIGEEQASFYTDSIKQSFNSYKDAAIVVLSRDSGEGQDFNKKDAEGVPQLSLHQSEKDRLTRIKNAGFKKTIVLINSGNAREVSELKEYGVNAVRWIGEPGRYGLAGVPSLLKGEANPSGRLVDTYATDSLSAPARANFGDFTFQGSDSTKYVVYTEGIYVGYKYYETRYEDSILSRFGASSDVGTFASKGSSWNYADEVSYPFGHGLSYTTFSQTLDDFSYDQSKDQYVATITVKNTGNVAGKSVAELYRQSPYTDYDKANKVEKSAIQIVGFGKTKTLKAGESETRKITVDRYLTASYDCHNAKSYILDAGDYYFALGDDAHDALNNVLSAKGYSSALVDFDGNKVTGNKDKAYKYTLSERDTQTYKKSNYTDETVTNVFTDDYATDANDFYDDDPVTYLTRQDWAGTFPTAPTVLTINDKITKARVSRYYEKDSNTAGLTQDQINGVDASIQFKDRYGVAYDDPKWDTFLSQLSIHDRSLIISDSLGQGAITSVTKPANKNADGPDGYGRNYRYGDQESPTCYNIQNLASSTWSTERMAKRGSFYGEDCIYSRGQMAWAPGLDIHRTPYGGRNFEYSSEDGLFTGIRMAAETKARAEKGVIASPKHLFGNEQETNRSGACTFFTEQTARELNLRAFEIPFTKGKAGGARLARNRIGCKRSPVAKTTLTNILRKEWGFTGILVTDSSGAENDRIPTVESLLAGTGRFCLARRTTTIEKAITDNNDSYLYEVLKETNHRFYYNYVNSTLINGLANDSVVSDVIGWWQPTVIIIDSLLGALCLASAGFYVYFKFFKKEDESKAKEEN